jgi:hypothetical protein
MSDSTADSMPHGQENMISLNSRACERWPGRGSSQTMRARFPKANPSASAWDCRHLSSEDALAKLQGKEPGVFVIRTSERSSAALTLCMVQPDGLLFQIRINEDGHGYRFHKSRSLHTDLGALIKRHQITRGALPCVLLDEQQEKPAWDCTDLAKAEAEARLACSNPFGTFIIRKGSAGFAILVYLSSTGLKKRVIEQKFDHLYGPSDSFNHKGSGTPALTLQGSENMFPDLRSLALFYMECANVDVPIKLKAPVLC